MTDAVIVSTARTGLVRRWKLAFSPADGATLAAQAIKHAVRFDLA